jgi:hypothetical protein
MTQVLQGVPYGGKKEEGRGGGQGNWAVLWRVVVPFYPFFLRLGFAGFDLKAFFWPGGEGA